MLAVPRTSGNLTRVAINLFISLWFCQFFLALNTNVMLFWPAFKLIRLLKRLLESPFLFTVNHLSVKSLTADENNHRFFLAMSSQKLHFQKSRIKSKMQNQCVTLFQRSHSRSQTKHTRSHVIFTFWHAHLHRRSERVKVQHWLPLKCSSDHWCSFWLPPMISGTDLSRLPTSDKIQPLVKMPSTESAHVILTGRDSSTFSLSSLQLEPSNLHIHLLPICSHVLMPNQAQIYTFSAH